ncbi:unnamed protein product, partial [Effrenium voratum]
AGELKEVPSSFFCCGRGPARACAMTHSASRRKAALLWLSTLALPSFLPDPFHAMSYAKVVNPFGVALFQYLAKKEVENVLISPMSISVCLSMVAAGATEGSGTQKELMGMGGGLKALPEASSMQMANSAWVRMAIKPEFLADIQKTFQADAFPLPSPDPMRINNWVKEKTQGLIPSLFEGPLDPLTVLVLVNTIYFKGSWASTFDAAKTTPGKFQSFKGKLPCDMMLKKEKNLSYADIAGFQAVQLPYSDMNTMATIILPKETGPGGLEKLVEGFDLEQVFHAMRPMEVELRMPRFKVSAGGSMKEALVALGIKETFGGSGGFLRMSDDPEVHLDEVMHKATVEVNEEGTVAAAATGAVMMTRCMPPPAQPMTVDRPFLFVISDKEGAISFIGKIVTPELSGIEAKLK